MNFLLMVELIKALSIKILIYYHARIIRIIFHFFVTKNIWQQFFRVEEFFIILFLFIINIISFHNISRILCFHKQPKIFTWLQKENKLLSISSFLIFSSSSFFANNSLKFSAVLMEFQKDTDSFCISATFLSGYADLYFENSSWEYWFILLRCEVLKTDFYIINIAVLRYILYVIPSWLNARKLRKMKNKRKLAILTGIKLSASKKTKEWNDNFWIKVNIKNASNVSEIRKTIHISLNFEMCYAFSLKKHCPSIQLFVLSVDVCLNGG